MAAPLVAFASYAALRAAPAVARIGVRFGASQALQRGVVEASRLALGGRLDSEVASAQRFLQAECPDDQEKQRGVVPGLVALGGEQIDQYAFLAESAVNLIGARRLERGVEDYRTKLASVVRSVRCE